MAARFGQQLWWQQRCARQAWRLTKTVLLSGDSVDNQLFHAVELVLGITSSVTPGKRQRWVLKAGSSRPKCKEEEVISLPNGAHGPALIWCRDDTFQGMITEQRADSGAALCERIWSMGRRRPAAWEWLDSENQLQSASLAIDVAVVGLPRGIPMSADTAAQFAHRRLGALLDRKITPIWRTRTPDNRIPFLSRQTLGRDDDAAAARVARELNISVVDLGGPASRVLHANALSVGNSHLDIFHGVHESRRPGHLMIGACADPLCGANPNCTTRTMLGGSSGHHECVNGTARNVIMADGVHFCTDYAAHWGRLVLNAIGSFVHTPTHIHKAQKWTKS